LEIESLVQSVFEYINTSNDHDLEVAINVHAWLLRIHPFADGNGRVIRLLVAFLTLSGGYTPIPFTCGVEEYFDGIRAWDKDTNKLGLLFVDELKKMAAVYDRAELLAVEESGKDIF
jgi:fido (protein-threonine AMPylation protein)